MLYNDYLYQVLLDQFSEHITTSFPYLKDKKLLIAISGGVDSVVLAELLNELDFDISLAHCNFQLRGADAHQDEVFVTEMASRIQSPLFTKKFETKAIAKAEKLSIQLAARELRYNWFENLLVDNDLDYIVTGHHADDNLETFLINLSRGTGLDGLTGIPEKNGVIVRPLLPFSRNQIEQYARKQNLNWREDASNAETKYLRNKLRHDVIPALKSINPRFLDTFSTTIQHLKGTQQIVAASVENIKLKVVHSDANGILKLDITELKKLVHSKALLYELLRGYNFTAWDDIYNLLEAQAGKFVVSNSHRILKDRDFLIISPILVEPGNEVYTLNSFPSSLQTASFQLKITKSDNFYPVKESHIIFVDADQLKWPITIRKWQHGDYFYPFGMQGKKKLSKFFKDQKYSLFDKENTWVLISDDKIVWVIDSRLDERFKVTDSTKTILKLELI